MDSFKRGDLVQIVLTEEFRAKLNSSSELVPLTRAIGTICKIIDAENIYWWRDEIPCYDVEYVSGPCPWSPNKRTMPLAMFSKISRINPVKRITNVRKAYGEDTF